MIMKKRKSPHKEVNLDRFLQFAMYSLWLLILLLCLIIFKCTTHASSGDNTAYFPMEQNANGHFTASQLALIDSYFDTENNYFFVRYDATYTNYTSCYVIWYPKTNTNGVYGEILSNGHQFSLYYSGSLVGSTIRNARLNNNGTVNLYTTTFVYAFQNINSSAYDTNCDYYSNFKLLTNNTDTATTVLKYGWELPPDFLHNESHATPPDTFESPVYTTGHTPPTNVPPTYTINNYTWSTYTPPTIDTSNAETLLESIYNAIVYNGQYLKDNIHGELTNLVDNIGGFVEYIGDTIQYYGNLIISNIQNGITTFYNNINSAIVGIGNAVGYITQPLDMDNLTSAVNSTHIWGDVDTCTTYANDAFGIYGTVAEPNSFKIPLDLRSISLLNITQVYYIDLSWLDGAKSAIRAFMWCVVTFGLLYSIIVDIPNMIRSSK